ncbi:MAG: alpha/beta fold hydrolase [Gammaproteobacteria bacterium]|nr:alpha/beta fold hydrolase [Gammaproteobacteria bacterium]
MIINNTKLFSDPNIHYPLLNNTLSFSNYIAQSRIIIKNTRLDLQIPSINFNNEYSERTNIDAKYIINSNAPFEWYPKNHIVGKKIKYGAILIHGLLDSPFIMRDIGNELHKEGMLVKAVLLPGHGTIPGALLHVNYLEWSETVRYAVETLAEEVEHIFLVGYSTGGTLALYQAIKHLTPISGIITFAPALKINCPLDFFARYPASLGAQWPRLAWFHRDKHETLDYAKYRSTPFNAAYQVYRLAKVIKQSEQPNCPLFFILSANDITVLSHVSMDYFSKNSHSKNRMIIYTKKQMNPRNDHRIIIRSSVYPEMHILDFSHISLPVRPDNSHYGIHGDYCEASHIEEYKNNFYGESYISLMNFYNFLNKWKLTPYRYSRLSFNPDFAFMSEQIKDFILDN